MSRIYGIKKSGVDFINVLLAAFTDHKSIKIQLSRRHLFALLGPAIHGRFILSILFKKLHL